MRDHPYFSKLELQGKSFSLESFKSLMKYFGNVQDQLKFIHIGGTTGKGSVATYLTFALMSLGFKVGTYTSPHLESYLERIKINNQEIKKKEFLFYLEKVWQAIEEKNLRVSFFEFLTAIAYLYFAAQRVEIVVLETGLGGRLDATNIIQPELSIITNISYDHTKYLGKTLSLIVREKAEIIKKSSVLISGVKRKSLRQYLEAKAREKLSAAYFIGQDFNFKKISHGFFDYQGIYTNLSQLKINLRGDFQIQNATLALAALEILATKWSFSFFDKIKKALAKAFIAGRVEVVSQKPLIVLDGAHNVLAIKALLDTLKKEFSFKRLIFLIGILKDKDFKKMMALIFNFSRHVVFLRPQTKRAMERELIQKKIGPGVKIKFYDSVNCGINETISLAKEGDLFCLTGSLYTVGEAREFLVK